MRRYFNANMFAPLPATLANDGKADTLLMVQVGDEVSTYPDRIERISVRVLLSIRYGRRNLPPAKGIGEHIELRLNNIRLSRPMLEGGWLVLPAVSRA